MRSYTVSAGGIDFKGSTPPAADALEALHVCVRTRLVPILQESSSDMALVTGMMNVAREDRDELARLIIKGSKDALVVRAEDNVMAGPNMFEDDPTAYPLLLAKVAVEVLGKAFWNLSREK